MVACDDVATLDRRIARAARANTVDEVFADRPARAVHRAKLTAEADPAVLRHWLARAATATRAAEVFAEDAG